MERANDGPNGRPSERRSAARTAVVWQALRPILADCEPSGTVVDIGGGTGGFAVGVAELGHRVAVIDPSPDALAALDRRAHDHGLAHLVTGQQGDLSSVAEVAGAESADVVLCHGVLELADDPAAALAGVATVLRPGGTLSLLVAQRHAAVITRAMAGHFQQAQALLAAAIAGQPDPVSGRGGRRFTSDEIAGLLAGAGLTIDTVHGIRVFADLVPGALVDVEPGAAQALAELEQAVAERPEYLPLATQLHVVAHR